MKRYYLHMSSLALPLIWPGCITPFDPSDQIREQPGMLVVEGTIAGGKAGTTVRLSRPAPLTQSFAYEPEAHAILFVEEESTGARWQLREDSLGCYSRPNLLLKFGDRYHLYIRTANGGEYVSDYLPVLESPPIDTIYPKVQYADVDRVENVCFMLDTHDPTNRTQYYRWEFEEDWEIYVQEEPNFWVDFVTGDYYYKRVTDRHYCWRHARSRNIVLGKTTAITESVISGKEIHRVMYGDRRSQVLYRMRVRQYALVPEAYEFWDYLRKHSEDIGDLLGPQPTSLPGNIRCLSNPGEPVTGYVGVSNPATCEVWVDGPSDFPGFGEAYASECVFRTFPPPLPIVKAYTPHTEYGIWNIQYPLGRPPQAWFGFRVNTSQLTDAERTGAVPIRSQPSIHMVNYEFCVDCTFSGGTKHKPLDWPNNHQ